MSTQTLIAKYQALPRAAQQQVENLIEALSADAQSAQKTGKRFAFDWAGGLADLKDKFTAVELQHHLLQLR